MSAELGISEDQVVMAVSQAISCLEAWQKQLQNMEKAIKSNAEKTVRDKIEELRLKELALEQREQALLDEKKMMQSVIGRIDEVVDVNVGGGKFTTARSTLCRFEGTKLEAMFSGRWKMALDREGRVFIDRDPKFFGTILNFLRDPEAHFELAVEDREAFQREVDWYGLTHVMFGPGGPAPPLPSLPATTEAPTEAMRENMLAQIRNGVRLSMTRRPR
eukprot:GILK01009687.1.p1 GENE.GILK01009687.1~~GILK01009687.1.p1  ORF type:complete len:231 (-),score=40.05 GILK01009687.1:122-775(-)